jgi:hypothetical protein
MTTTRETLEMVTKLCSPYASTSTVSKQEILKSNVHYFILAAHGIVSTHAYGLTPNGEKGRHILNLKRILKDKLWFRNSLFARSTLDDLGLRLNSRFYDIRHKHLGPRSTTYRYSNFNGAEQAGPPLLLKTAKRNDRAVLRHHRLMTKRVQGR